MNKEIIHQAIANPEFLSELEIESLREISLQFPYFSSAQILLTKAYHLGNDHRYTDQLHHAAIYSADRKVLYHWLKEKPIVNTSTEQFQEEPITEKETGLPENKKSVGIGNEEWPDKGSRVQSSEDLVDLILSDEQAGDKMPVEILVPAGVNLQEEDTPVVEEAASAEIIQSVAVHKAPDLGPLQQDMLLEAMQSSITLELKEVTDDNENLTEVKTVIEEEYLPAAVDSYASWMYERARQIHFHDAGKSSRPAGEVAQGVQDWLRLKIEPEGEVTEAQKSIDEAIPDEQISRLSHGIKKIHPIDDIEHQRDLINRFIRTEPQIPRGKANEYSAGNIAKESLEDDFSLVTETMAKLYARQGKLDRAKKAFKKLIELYPEKSVYFAAQLKNLDKLKK